MKIDAHKLAFFAAMLGYCGLTMALGNGPMQDVPNHLARAHIMADLLFDHGAEYGSAFHLQLLFRPYLLGDIVLLVFDRLFGSTWAARIWISLSVLLIPLGALFALRSMRLPRSAVFTGAILSLYVATGWTFTMGFLNYEVSLGCALFTYGWFIRAQHSNSAVAWSCFALMAFLTYTMHLSGLVFICAVVGIECFVRMLRGEFPWWRAALLFGIPVVLLASDFVLGRMAPGPVGYTHWGGVHDKFAYLLAPIVRFGFIPDLLLFAVFLAALAIPLLTSPMAGLRRALIPLLCAIVLVGLYFALPSVANDIYHVDIRALPYALAFTVFAGMMMGTASPMQARWQLLLACMLIAANLAYTAAVMKTEDRRLGAYRELLSALPPGQRVLPVYTRPPIGRYRPLLHAGSYATLQRGALTPYLFAADINPPLPYFSYARPRGYAPSEHWYENIIDEVGGETVAGTFRPDWAQIERQFDYLLVTLPWKPELIPSSYTVVARNDVAALLMIHDR